MDPQRYRRIKEILFAAHALTGAERAMYLDRACGGDDALRREVEQFLVPDAVSTDAALGEGLRPRGEAGAHAVAMPEQLGVYRTGAEIGRGGMGVVHVATDSRTGERVALKRVHGHLLASRGALDRFRREARIGRRVDHENVIRTLGLETFELGGELEHVLVMEYVAGRNGRELLDEYGTVPEGLVREIATQVCAGLSAIHATGIVHRDLKPENVLVTDDQRVRIMDLGVAKPVETTIDVTSPGQFVGSLAYAAPEQFGNAGIGPSADLYSLGVALYELATGENPFDRDHPAATMRAHLDETAPPARDRNPQVSRFLSDVLDTLLAKDPAERFASADALRAVLLAGETGAWWTARSDGDRGHAELPEIQGRRETALHGRSAELALLRDAWRDAVSGGGRVVLLEGEAGIGKTRLVQALIDDVSAEEAHVLYGSFPPSGGLGGVTDAIVTKLRAAGLEQTLPQHVEMSADLVPGLAALLRRDTPPVGAPALRREVVESVCCQVLGSLAKDRPTLWVVDDLHFAPARGRAIARALARAAEAARAMVLLTTRPGLSDADRDELRRTPGFAHVTLGRLSPRAVQDLIREAFHSEAAADELGARIAYKSDGVPFFVFEMLHALTEQDYLARRADGSYEQRRTVTNIDVPSAVRDLIATRLKGLSRPEREVADVAAVDGFEFDAERVAAVLDRPVVSVLQDLAEIERRHAIVRSVGRGYRFDHHQIQEVLYDDISPRLREEYHALIAEAAEARAGARPQESGARDTVFLVSHYLRGSRPAACAPYIGSALEHLERDDLHEEVITLIDRALGHEALVSGAERVELQLRQTFGLAVMGQHDREEEVALAALEGARAIGDLRLEARALGRVAAHARAAGDFPKSISRRRVALEVAQRSGDARLELKQMAALGGDLLFGGERDEAVGILESCRDRAFESGDRETEAGALADLGLLWVSGGRPDLARTALQRARDIAEEIGDRYRLAQAEGNLGLVCWHTHLLAEARRHYLRGLELARAVGARNLVALGHGGVGQVCKDLGRLGEARAHFERQYTISRELGDRIGKTYGLVNLINLWNTLGDLDRSEALADEALALIEGVANPRFVAGITLLRSETAAMRGGRTAARDLGRQALELFRAIGERTFEGEVLVYLGAMAREDGDLDTARELLAAGSEIAHELPHGRLIVISTAQRALLPEGDPATLLGALAEYGPSLSLLARIEALFLAWKATGDRGHLEESRRLVETLIDEAPEECREAMARNVPLYRDVLAAASLSP